VESQRGTTDKHRPQIGAESAAIARAPSAKQGVSILQWIVELLTGKLILLGGRWKSCWKILTYHRGPSRIGVHHFF
jgi:hypothetical protein